MVKEGGKGAGGEREAEGGGEIGVLLHTSHGSFEVLADEFDHSRDIPFRCGVSPCTCDSTLHHDDAPPFGNVDGGLDLEHARSGTEKLPVYMTVLNGR